MTQKILKLILCTSLICLVFSCSSKKDDPLIIPPNFNEMPDPKNPEKPTLKQQEENVDRLKELLLKSD